MRLPAVQRTPATQKLSFTLTLSKGVAEAMTACAADGRAAAAGVVADGTAAAAAIAPIVLASNGVMYARRAGCSAAMRAAMRLRCSLCDAGTAAAAVLKQR